MPDPMQQLFQLPGAKAKAPWAKAIGSVGLPLAVGGGLLALGAGAEKVKSVSRPRITAEVERRIGRPLEDEEKRLANEGYDLLKEYAPSTLRHPAVASNYIRQMVWAKEIDPTLVNQLVRTEKEFRQAPKPGAGGIGLITGLGKVLSDIVF